MNKSSEKKSEQTKPAARSARRYYLPTEGKTVEAKNHDEALKAAEKMNEVKEASPKAQEDGDDQS